MSVRAKPVCAFLAVTVTPGTAAALRVDDPPGDDSGGLLGDSGQCRQRRAENDHHGDDLAHASWPPEWDVKLAGPHRDQCRSSVSKPDTMRTWDECATDSDERRF